MPSIYYLYDTLIFAEDVGHTNECQDNFKFLLQQAEKINIYQPEDYKKIQNIIVIWIIHILIINI